MMPSYPSSTCASNGSAKIIEACEPSFSESEASKSKQLNSNNASASQDPNSSNSNVAESQGTSNSSINQAESDYSACRIAAFVKDDNNSQVLQRKPSPVASIQNRTVRMATYINEFDATFASL